MIWTWWMTLLVIFAVLFLIGCIPVGVDARQDGEGLRVKAKVWFLGLQLIPKKGKKKKKKIKKTEKKKEKSKAGEETPKQKFTLKGNEELIDLGVDSLFELLDILSDISSRFEKKLRLEELTLHLTVSSADPAKRAISYGRAWAVIGALTPRLEQHFVIKKRDIQPILDYNTNEMKLEGRLLLTITIGRIFRIVMRLLGRSLKLGTGAGIRYLRWKRKKKAEQRPVKNDKTENTINKGGANE